MAKHFPQKPKPNEPKDQPEPPAADVPAHRQCPLCFHGQGGVGRQYSKQGATAYYKCKDCGHTWTARVKLETTVIEHRVVELDTREDPDGE